MFTKSVGEPFQNIATQIVVLNFFEEYIKKYCVFVVFAYYFIINSTTKETQQISLDQFLLAYVRKQH